MCLLRRGRPFLFFNIFVFAFKSSFLCDFFDQKVRFHMITNCSKSVSSQRWYLRGSSQNTFYENPDFEGESPLPFYVFQSFFFFMVLDASHLYRSLFSQSFAFQGSYGPLTTAPLLFFLVFYSIQILFGPLISTVRFFASRSLFQGLGRDQR